MRVSDQASERFYQGVRSDQVRFVYNDNERVTSGAYAGSSETVVSLIAVEPVVVQLVELDERPWEDIEVQQANIEGLD